jgi:uroporphyrinogen-III synthase
MRLLFLFLLFLMMIFSGCLQKKHSLKDKRIVITAPEIYAKRLQKALEKYDAEVVAMPAIETIVYDSLIGWPEKEQPGLPSAELVRSYDFIVLPSRNAIKSFKNDMRRRLGNS